MSMKAGGGLQSACAAKGCRHKMAQLFTGDADSPTQVMHFFLDYADRPAAFPGLADKSACYSSSFRLNRRHTHTDINSSPSGDIYGIALSKGNNLARPYRVRVGLRSKYKENAYENV
jgi:hypothetical protein